MRYSQDDTSEMFNTSCEECGNNYIGQALGAYDKDDQSDSILMAYRMTPAMISLTV